MITSIYSWYQGRKNIINSHYLSKRLHPKFILGIFYKIILELGDSGKPWITHQSINMLSQLLRSDDIVLEFGSGQSTLWLAGISNHVTSVEHDPKWYKKIINDDRFRRSHAKLIYAPNRLDYLKVIDTYKNNSIDFCFVDGLWRRDCLLGVFKKIKTGGIIVLDNAETFLPITWKSHSFQDSWAERGSPERKKIDKITTELKKWRTLATSDVTQDTVFFVKK